MQLWTDGACRGNPGPGGWAAILVWRGRERELSGGEPRSTNNRMELLSVIRGLESLRQPCLVTVYTDSTYVHHGFSKRWVENWVRRGWKTAAGKPVANQDLWERLIEQVALHQVSWEKVSAHQGVELNERCDQLAVRASHQQRV